MAKKQKELPGLERKTIAEIDAAAESYQDIKLKRMDLTREEKLKKDALVYVMKKHNLEVYKDKSSGLTVHLKPGRDGVQVTEMPEDAEAEKPEAKDANATAKVSKKKGSASASAASSTSST